MLLRNNLYEITARRTTEDGFTAYDLSLHATHIIYSAHFPGHPITPGVCLVQIAKELLEDRLGRSLDIIRVKNVKFLSVVSPMETPCITCVFRKIEVDAGDDKVVVQALITAGEQTMTKISMECR